MDDKGRIQSIKFSPGNQILAVQRSDSSTEFISIVKGELQTNDPIIYKGKSLPIYGFVWISDKEVAIFSSGGIELLQVIVEKKTLKHVKSLNLTINKFEWCPAGKFALLHSNKGTILTPVIIRPGSISKLPKLERKFCSFPLKHNRSYSCPYPLRPSTCSSETRQETKCGGHHVGRRLW